jgi:hypothetical protein
MSHLTTQPGIYSANIIVNGLKKIWKPAGPSQQIPGIAKLPANSGKRYAAWWFFALPL